MRNGVGSLCVSSLVAVAINAHDYMIFTHENSLLTSSEALFVDFRSIVGRLKKFLTFSKN